MQSCLNKLKNNNVENRILSMSILLTLVCCTSCMTAIDPSAANSASGIIAVFFEGLYAIITLALVFVCWVSRGIGLSGIIFGLLIIVRDWNSSVPSWVPILIGLILFVFSFIPIRPHKFTVIISNKLPSILKSIETKTEAFNIWKELLLPIAISVVSLIIEYHWFIPKE